MTEGTYRTVAQLFQILSHPVRLRILDELRKGEACVCHFQTALNRPQAYVSQQLRVLREAGVIDSYKDGLFVFYQIADPQVEKLVADVLGPAGPPVCVPGCGCPRCGGDDCR